MVHIGAMKNIDRILSISSAPMSEDGCAALRDSFRSVDSALLEQLEYMLSKNNGFYVFESALQVYTCKENDVVIDIYSWNAPDGWKSLYFSSLRDILFFSQDVFGSQFGLTGGSVIRFDPESGDIFEHSESLDEWAKMVCKDYDYQTGWSLAKQWQVKNGPLKSGYRLLPKIPFVIGGGYEVDNLLAVKAEEAMLEYGKLYRQISNAADGEKVTLRNWIGSRV
jgi:hypothetical protein